MTDPRVERLLTGAGETLARIRPLFLDACARSREVPAGPAPLDVDGDLLREVLDGSTGE